MATFHGYMVFIVGLSLLLAFAGVATGVGVIMNKFIDVNVDGVEGTIDVNTTTANPLTNNTFVWIIGLLATLGAIAGAIFSKDVAGALKAGACSVMLAWLINDFIAIFNYANSITALDGIIKAVAFVIYLPLFIGSFISALNWIGGGQ